MIRLLTYKASCTEIIFKEFDTDLVPAYAILSHTWLEKHEDEVTFEDFDWDQDVTRLDGSRLNFVQQKLHPLDRNTSGSILVALTNATK